VKTYYFECKLRETVQADSEEEARIALAQRNGLGGVDESEFELVDVVESAD